MATSSSRDADKHRADQAALVALLHGEVAELWDPADGPPNGAELDALIALVQQYSQASALISADYYDTARAVAELTSTYTTPLAAPPGREEIEAAVGFATRTLKPGGSEPKPDVAHTEMQGVLQRLVVDTGRETLAQAAQFDPDAARFVRVPEPGACYFCMMLAIRGGPDDTQTTAKGSGWRGVYHDANTAGRNANRKFVGNGNFKFHDNCRCDIKPIYKGQHFVPSPEVEAAEKLYYSSTENFNGDDKRKAFRRAFEAAS